MLKKPIQNYILENISYQLSQKLHHFHIKCLLPAQLEIDDKTALALENINYNS